MKLKQVPIGRTFQPTQQWYGFRLAGEPDKPLPEKFEVVARKADAVLCNPVGGGPSTYFYGELEVMP